MNESREARTRVPALASIGVDAAKIWPAEVGITNGDKLKQHFKVSWVFQAVHFRLVLFQTFANFQNVYKALPDHIRHSTCTNVNFLITKRQRAKNSGVETTFC